MDKLSNLALVAQMVDSAEKSLQSARHLLREILGGTSAQGDMEALAAKAQGLSVSSGGKVIEGVFDGQNMIGPDSKQYPVPANYASKSKLVEGDVLKLTIAEDGSFIYKQIAPVERKKMLGTVITDERGDMRVMAEGKAYKVLTATLTYFKSGPGDQATILVPEGKECNWAAIEHVIRPGETMPTGDDGVVSATQDEEEM